MGPAWDDPDATPVADILEFVRLGRERAARESRVSDAEAFRRFVTEYLPGWFADELYPEVEL